MTVKELIKKLNELEQDRKIFMWDYDYWDLREINIKADAKVRYKLKWYNEMGNGIMEWDLRDYESAEDMGYDIISKEDIYLIE